MFAKRYLINPAAATETLWTPQIFQIIMRHKNPNYLNSLWLGTAWNLLLLPFRLATELLWPLFNFKFGLCLLALVGIPFSAVNMFWNGVQGKTMAMQVSIDQAVYSILLTPEQGVEALEQGANQPVLDLMLLMAQEQGMLPEGQTIPGFPANWRDDIRA